MKILLSVVSVGIFTFGSTVFAAGSHSGGHGHHEEHGSHKHDSWVQPPASYSGKSWNQWENRELAQKGKALYQQQCASCHGASGKGDGPVARGLAHQPADLTNHFHLAQGKGDDYLFWRISEGGTVAPFNGMQSAMPAFKNAMSESDRWAVLTYIHQDFHGGFKQKHHEQSGHHH
jgi:mono/diheme cytochrome c family protein